MKIPKIIHQVWEGRSGEQIPQILSGLATTWQYKNPSWQYQLWDYKAIDEFLMKYFPDFISKYHSFRYNVQRWDAIRYLILYQFGGLYVDIDYECIEPIDDLIFNHECCFGLEPPQHSKAFNMDFTVGNAFIASIPKHPFFLDIFSTIQSIESTATDKFLYVLETTGPHMLTNLYNKYNSKKDIYNIPFELVTPLDIVEVRQLMKGFKSDETSRKIDSAYAIHYFWGSWQKDEK